MLVSVSLGRNLQVEGKAGKGQSVMQACSRTHALKPDPGQAIRPLEAIPRALLHAPTQLALSSEGHRHPHHHPLRRCIHAEHHSVPTFSRAVKNKELSAPASNRRPDMVQGQRISKMQAYDEKDRLTGPVWIPCVWVERQGISRAVQRLDACKRSSLTSSGSRPGLCASQAGLVSALQIMTNNVRPMALCAASGASQGHEGGETLVPAKDQIATADRPAFEHRRDPRAVAACSPNALLPGVSGGGPPGTGGQGWCDLD